MGDSIDDLVQGRWRDIRNAVMVGSKQGDLSLERLVHVTTIDQSEPYRVKDVAWKPARGGQLSDCSVDFESAYEISRSMTLTAPKLESAASISGVIDFAREFRVAEMRAVVAMLAEGREPTRCRRLDDIQEVVAQLGGISRIIGSGLSSTIACEPAWSMKRSCLATCFRQVRRCSSDWTEALP